MLAFFVLNLYLRVKYFIGSRYVKVCLFWFCAISTIHMILIQCPISIGEMLLQKDKHVVTCNAYSINYFIVFIFQSRHSTWHTKKNTCLKSTEGFDGSCCRVSTTYVLLCLSRLWVGSIEDLEHELSAHTHTGLQVCLGSLHVVQNIRSEA